MKINIPLSVPKNKEKEYRKNFEIATRGTGKLMMFAGDQKVEHLNNDFVGPGIPAEVADPEHYFRIASKAKIGVFATQIGLLDMYGRDYPNIPYIIKINSKTNLINKEQRDPMSERWLHMEEIVEYKKQSKLNIVGVGYTIYLGSWYEAEMFGQAARIIHKAHQEGMISVIWVYTRGKSIKPEDETNIKMIAGAAGVAVCLGTDFVKLTYPYDLDNKKTASEYREVTTAAGRTGVVCIGGKKQSSKKFLQCLSNQTKISGTRGVAIGRNIYQRKLDEAIRMANAISSISLYDYSAENAYDIFLGKKQLKEK